MSESYGPSGGRVLRRAVLWTLGGAAALAVLPRLIPMESADSVLAPERAANGRVPPARAPGAAAPADTEIFYAGPDGQFYVTAAVNGFAVPFVVDTGASRVALRLDDARRLGFDPARLRWNLLAQTANGDAYAAAVTLAEVRLGRIAEYNVPAAVMHQGAGLSLLGMSFLSRLKSWQIEDNVLTIGD